MNKENIIKELKNLKRYDMMVEYNAEYSEDEIVGYKNYGGDWIKAEDVKRIIEIIKGLKNKNDG